MKKGRKIFSIVVLCLVGMHLFAADLYVSKNTGKNRGGGSKKVPYKNLQKALTAAKSGDTIYVAEGNYYGLLDKGSLELKQAVKLYGGYTSDFSKRDVLKYQTRIMPPAKTNSTAANAGMFYLDIRSSTPGDLVIDGIIFDKGDSNAYHASKGKPKGVETGMYLTPPGRGSNGFTSAQSNLLGGVMNRGTVLIQNCVFNNGDKYAIQLRLGSGVKARVINNVFTANLYAAAEIWGSASASLEFAYNTVLFNWSRTKALEDMGYGFRCMTSQDTNVHHNIIGLSNLAGIDRTRVDNNQTVNISDNMFFMNGQSDMVVPGGGKYLRIFVDMIDDVEVITSSEGNAELSASAGKALKSVLNIPYLEGFLSATYTETSDYNASSPMNEARRALGLNQVGKINSSVSMFGNRYPLEDSIKLFGVVKGYGAQAIKK